MRTRFANLIVLALVACGPLDISITSTGDDSRPPVDGTTSSSGTTSLGATSSDNSTSAEPTDSSTGPSASSTSEGSSSGGGSSTGPGCVPLPPAEPSCGITQGGLCGCGALPTGPDACGCEVCDGECRCNGLLYDISICDNPVPPCDNPTVQNDEDAWHCLCGSTKVDPVWCGCELNEIGSCTCDAGIFDSVTCGWPCNDGIQPCTCGNFPAPSTWCEV